MKLRKFIEKIIFNSGYAALSFYLVIELSLLVYAFFNIKEFLHYVYHVNEINSKVAMLTFIELIDMGLIAGLGVMMIKGSYCSFVNKEHDYQHECISSGFLKVKMKTSLITIVAIHLLQYSVFVENTTWDVLLKIGFIYGSFVVGGLVLELIDYIHLKSEAFSDANVH